MIPTGSQIAEEARRTYIGETETPGGERFTDETLRAPIGAAYRILFSQLMRVDERKARRTAYYNLPAYTSYLSPSAMGLANLGAPKELWERSISTTATGTILAINAGTNTTPPSVDITVTAHGLSTGAQIVAYNFSGMTADINDIWHIEVVDANTIRLLGCTAQAAPATLLIPTVGVTSTGVITTSSEDFPGDPVTALMEVTPRRSPNSKVNEWAWKDGAFRFAASSQARQLKISYMVSGDYGSDLNLSTGIDNCTEFIACYAAALATNAMGAGNTAAQLFTMAVGNPSGDPGEADAGYLGAFIRPQIKAAEHVRIQTPPFRPKRNTGWPVGF